MHSTGHQKRLVRKGITQSGVSFGDEIYSKEELVAAQLCMLCEVAGIENATIENSVRYFQSWLRALKEEPKLVVHAAAQAQKATAHIQSVPKKDFYDL